MASPEETGDSKPKRRASSQDPAEDVTASRETPAAKKLRTEDSGSEGNVEHVEQLKEKLYEAALPGLKANYNGDIPDDVKADVRRDCERSAQVQVARKRQSKQPVAGGSESGEDGENGEIASSSGDSNGDSSNDSKGSNIPSNTSNKLDSTTNTSTKRGNIATSKKDAAWLEDHNGTSEPSSKDGTTEAPPLPEEAIPPLPSELPPGPTPEDDGWAPVWDETAQAFYFYNRFTGATQWENPRVPVAPTAPAAVAPGVEPVQAATSEARVVGGYNPAIHGDYDPTAWYAQPVVPEEPPAPAGAQDPAAAYAQTGTFNRFTGRFQNPELNPENFNDENKSKRQMNAFFDVDAAANSHDGRSLKEERSGKRISKQELKQFKEKRKAKKEEKRRAWLLD